MKICKKISAILTAAIMLLPMLPNCVNAAYEYDLRDWRGVSFANITEGEQAELFVDTVEKHSGNASLYIKYNESYTANHFLQIMLGGKTVSSEKKYKLSYWVKVKSMGGVNPHFSWDWTAIQWISRPSDEEWTYAEVDFQPTADNFYLNLFVEDPLEMWLDDVSLFELDSEGNTIGDNLVKNGGLEDCKVTPAAEVTNASALAGMNTVRINWQNPEDKSLYGVRIYQVNDDGSQKLVFSDYTKELDEATITDLDNDTMAKFLIKTVSNYGSESEGVFVFAEPVNDPIVVESVRAVRRNGKYYGIVKLANYSEEDEKKVTCIMAVYKDEKMIGMQTLEKNVAKSKAENYTLTLSSDTDGAVVELYLCDDLDNLKPLSKTIYSGSQN